MFQEFRDPLRVERVPEWCGSPNFSSTHTILMYWCVVRLVERHPTKGFVPLCWLNSVLLFHVTKFFSRPGY